MTARVSQLGLRLRAIPRVGLLAGIVVVAGCGNGRPAAENSSVPEVTEPTAAASPAPEPAGAAQESSSADGNQPVPEAEPLMKFEEANGFEIYQRYCAVCHGESGTGDGFNAFNLDPKPFSLAGPFARDQMSDEDLARSISAGGAGRNKSPRMPGWGKTLNSRQIRYVVSYIRQLQERFRASEANLTN